jgi:hypothetical protein
MTNKLSRLELLKLIINEKTIEKRKEVIRKVWDRIPSAQKNKLKLYYNI